DTSGVLVLAKTPTAHQFISRQFLNRKVKKTYIGLVKGVPPVSEGTLEGKIGRHPHKRRKFTISDIGRHSLTQFQVRERFQNTAAMLDLFPLTGRTHQIRVQLSGYQHPILGDAIYGGKGKDFDFVPRQMLHAAKIQFVYPEAQKKVTFEAPLPNDFQSVIKRLRLDKK
ncbi:hypothetical protein BVX98_06285, partial [bacterium F11]